MKINIIFPYNTWGGAFRSTYELANHMAVLGNSVEIYMPFFPYLEGVPPWSFKGMGNFVQGLSRSILRGNRVPWFDLRVPLKLVPLISERFLRDADIVMANHWPTAFSVAELTPKKGKKFYFIRDANTHLDFFQPEMNSFRLPLARIVTLSWLKAFLEKEIGVNVTGIVPNGINMKSFEVEEKRYNDIPVVCMMYYDHPQKGMDDGLAALKKVKERHPEVKILMFGWRKPKNLPFEAEFHLRPVKEMLRALYARSDIFLSPSLREGYHNPPREAMAAQCAVVATNVGCIPDCTIAGETALVVEPGDVTGMIEGICGLIENPRRIPELGSRGREYIRQFTWEKATNQLLELLRTH